MSLASRQREEATALPREVTLGSGQHVCTTLMGVQQEDGSREFVCDFLPDYALKMKPDNHLPNMKFVESCVNADPLNEALWKAAARLLYVEGLPNERCDTDCQGCSHPELCGEMLDLRDAVEPLRPRYGEDTTEEEK